MITESALSRAQATLSPAGSSLAMRLAQRLPDLRIYSRTPPPTPHILVANHTVVWLPPSAIRAGEADHLVISVEIRRARNELSMTAELMEDPGAILRELEPRVAPLSAGDAVVVAEISAFVERAVTFIDEVYDDVVKRVGLSPRPT